MRILNSIKKLAQLVLRDYSFYQIYGRHCTSEKALLLEGFRFKQIEKDEIDDSEDGIIAEQAWYHRQDTHAYACIEGTRIVGLCFFWYGEGYSKRNFWPLADREAKLVQLFVLPQMRGRGIARSLIEFATEDMFYKEFKYVYARIWRSNVLSLRAFERASWGRVATVIEIYLRGRSKPFRANFRRTPS
jgi:ribosomal protein S18 acetylase RimI-like enzyme